MNILLSGYHGRMGKEIRSLADAGYRNASVVCGVDVHIEGNEEVPCFPNFENADGNVDCVVDFSHHSVTPALLAFAVKHRLPLIIATTGHTEEEKAQILEAAKSIPLFFSYNYSLGIALLIETAKTVARAMPEADIEIVETHHDRKLDAPSGTALSIAEALQSVRPELFVHNGRRGHEKRDPKEIGIHAIRMGNIVGIHEVIIGTDTQTITLKHEAHDRKVLAEGALAAAEFLIGKPNGLYGMQDLLNL